MSEPRRGETSRGARDVGFLRRRTPGSASGLTPEDAQLLKHLRKQGADLAEPRHVLHYRYFPSEHTARQAAEAADATERPDVVLSDDVVRDSTDFFRSLPTQHSGEYDGWEAAVH